MIHNTPPRAYLTPINSFEAVFAPLYDYERGESALWHAETANQVTFAKKWMSVDLSWQNRPADGLLLRLSRTLSLNVVGYDTLLVTVALPEGLSLKATWSDGVRTASQTVPARPLPCKEHAFALDGITRLETLTLELYTAKESGGTAFFKWMGVQQSAGLAMYESQAREVDTEWRGFLEPESKEPSFEPQLGIVLSKDEVAHLRSLCSGAEGEAFTANLRAGVDPWRHTVPEKAIKDFLNPPDTREIRDRDIGKDLLRSEKVAESRPEGYAESFAVAGLVLKDRHLLRLAARYALSIAATRDWRDAFTSNTPGMGNRGVGFCAALASKSIVYALEAAGDLLTYDGRIYLLKRHAEGGTGMFQYEDWFRDRPDFSIFNTNQYSWFARGRIPALLALETTSHRVKAYTEIAMDGLRESFDRAITEDGGGLEGPVYFIVLLLSGG